MKGYKLNGDDAVTKISAFNITGNVVPLEWFNRIRFKLTEKSKIKTTRPHTVAIMLLADIVYWYRWIEVRDEKTGRLIERRKKFAADKLQRDYQSFADLYGYTKNQVRDALNRLQELGLIELDFRHPVIDGVKFGNLLFIGLNADKVIELSTPLSDLKSIGVPLSTLNTTPSQTQSQEAIDFKADTNTETTTETATEIHGAIAPMVEEPVYVDEDEIVYEPEEETSEGSLFLESDEEPPVIEAFSEEGDSPPEEPEESPEAYFERLARQRPPLEVPPKDIATIRSLTAAAIARFDKPRWCSRQAWPLARKFIEKLERSPAPSECALWNKEFKKWIELGVTEDNVSEMFDHHRGQNLSIKSPGSITWAFDQVRMNAKSETKEEYVNVNGVLMRKAALDAASTPMHFAFTGD